MYHFSYYTLWVQNMVSLEGVWKQNVEREYWDLRGSVKRRVEKAAELVPPLKT
jgi:hypothetical protein